MIILGIDTSTENGGIGIIEEKKVLSECNLHIKDTHSNQLMPLLDEILERLELEISQIDAFAVALGPGMFTALRIGIGTVKGLGYALNKPVVGIPTLDAIANNLKFVDRLICPVMDARRNEVFTAIYQGGKESGRDGNRPLLQRLSDYLCIPFDRVTEIVDEPTIFLGDATDKYRNFIESSMKDAVIADSVFDLPRGANIAMLGKKKLLSEGIDNQKFKENIFSLTPLYVRKSQAEVKYEKGILKSKQII